MELLRRHGARIVRLRGVALAWLIAAAAIVAGLCAAPASAVTGTIVCSLSPAQIPTLHFTNAGDGSFQSIGLTYANAKATGCSTGFSQLTTIRGVDPATDTGQNINSPLSNVTAQGGGLNHPVPGEVTYRPPSPSFSGTDTFKIDNGNPIRQATVTVIVDPAYAPAVTSLSASSGPAAGGTSVTITGTAFLSATAVRFGATAASFTVNGTTSITATAPAGSGTVDVRITNPIGTSAAVAADRFTYTGGTPTASAFTASAVAYNTGAASATSIDLTSRVTNSPTSYAVVSGTTSGGGTVSVTNAGIVSYTPAAGFRGNDSFYYTATNGAGTSGATLATVPVSNPTLAIALSATSGTFGVPLSGVAVTASGGKAAYSCATTPASGSLRRGLRWARTARCPARRPARGPRPSPSRSPTARPAPARSRRPAAR